MKKKTPKPVSEWLYAIPLTLIMALAVILRALPTISSVFSGGKVIFREVDPFYQMRLVENMALNNFHPLRWDFYAMYPDGAPVGYGPIIGWLTNWFGYAFGNGHPSQHLVDIIGAWLPPVAAAAVILIVYFLGKEVFRSRFVGLFAGVLVAIIPSEFLHRSLLGFTDNHVFEVLFSLFTILCLTKALRLKSWYWLGAAVASFALYAGEWIGWPILGAVLVGWAYFYFYFKWWVIKYPKNYNKSNLWFLPLAVLALVIIFIPGIRTLAYNFLGVVFLGFTGTIQEALPVSPKDYYLLYGLSGVIAFAGVYLAIKHKISSLFLTFGIFFLVASIAEKRWGYYSTIAIALFTAYAIQWSGSKVKKDWKPYILAYCCIAVVLATWPYTLGVIKRPVDIPPDWYNACVWLRENTPEPFSSGPDAYYSQNTGEASHGVFTWWDYGHWIIQIGHRVPLCSPTQQESPYYGFFTADTEDKANAILKGLDVRYVMVDDTMASSKYYAIWNKVTGGKAGWQESLKQSMVYKLYNGEVKSWTQIQQFGTVKLFTKSP